MLVGEMYVCTLFRYRRHRAAWRFAPTGTEALSQVGLNFRVTAQNSGTRLKAGITMNLRRARHAGASFAWQYYRIALFLYSGSTGYIMSYSTGSKYGRSKDEIEQTLQFLSRNSIIHHDLFSQKPDSPAPMRLQHLQTDTCVNSSFASPVPIRILFPNLQADFSLDRLRLYPNSLFHAHHPLLKLPKQ